LKTDIKGSKSWKYGINRVRAQAFFKQRACSGAHAFVSQNSQSRVRAHSFKKSESQTEVSS
jgi:hypothetical protein